MASYLFTKSLAAGIFLAGAAILPPLRMDAGFRAAVWIPGLALLFLAITGGLLVGDLKRPDRFLLILRRPQWGSWIARGAFVLVAYGGLLAFWLALAAAGAAPVAAGAGNGRPLALTVLVALTMLAAALAACYTAWLFHQSRGRVLWMQRGLALRLIAQAVLAGAALLLVLAPFLGIGPGEVGVLRRILLVGLVLHLGTTLLEPQLAPRQRAAEYARVARLVSHGPFAPRHWVVGVGLGTVAPMVLLLLFMPPLLWSIGAALALAGLFVEEDILVRAGQALPIS